MPIKENLVDLVKHYNPLKAFNGYTLFGPVGSTDMWLVDMKGNFINHWEVPNLLGGCGKLLGNGHLLVGNRLPDSPIADFPTTGGELLEYDWNGEIVWKYRNLYLNFHDLERLENGNTLISVWEPIPDEVARRVKGGMPRTERKGVMWSDCLQEITPEGKQVWEWKSYEHLDINKDIICPLCSRTTWSYCNSLVALPNGDILLSFRVLNSIAIIDRNMGNIKWSWGKTDIGHQHSPTMLGNGNILVFDNGLHCSSDVTSLCRSRVIEVNPVSNKIEWEYVDKDMMAFNSPICSNAQRLPNGNTLVCEATKGRIFEITMEKEIVWDFFNPFYFHYRPQFFGEWTNLVYRAYRYGPDYGGLQGKKLDPGRFEWVLRERDKPMAPAGAQVGEEALNQRLRMLGY